MREVLFILLVISILSVMACITAFTLSNLININIPTKKVMRVAIGSVILFVIATAGMLLTK